ncbi:hypothetical protein Taro_006302, partial [Colocasia esculenta]|nr:hypothetical protein [Colocasia esculenta]
LKFISAMASRGRRGGPSAREDEPRREERVEQLAPAPQGPVLSPPPPVDDYGVFMQGLVQAMQTQAHTQATLQAQLEAHQAQVPAQDHGGPSIMERFKRMLPPSFKGESDPLLAESWMREIEKIFRAIRKEPMYGGLHCCVPGLKTTQLMLLGTMAFDHLTLDEALTAACRQEGEIEQYLEEKKASQKRPVATFQRQDKKKAVYHTQQRSVAIGNAQRPQDQGLPKTSTGSPARSASPSSGSGSSASYKKTRKMKDYDAILGLDWLEEHYALVDCRGKRIVFRIPGEDGFSHPLPRNLAGKMVISAVKAMRMVNNGCDAFLASVAFVAQLSLRSSVLDEVIEKQKADPRLLELVGKAGIARDEDGGSWDKGEGFPDIFLGSTASRNPEEGIFGSFLGLPKESFTGSFDPFGEFLKGKEELGINALDAKISSLVGDVTPVEEAMESDSECGD